MIPAVISATAAIVVAALTFYWTKRRDRDADWRKLNNSPSQTRHDEVLSDLLNAMRSDVAAADRHSGRYGLIW